MVSLGLDGSVRTQGSEISFALESDPTLAAEVEHDKEEMEVLKADEELTGVTGDSSKGKLIMTEEIVHGHVTWRSMNLLLLGLGGAHPIVFFTLWIGGLLTNSVTSALQPWFLGVWGSQYETHHPSDVDLT